MDSSKEIEEVKIRLKLASHNIHFTLGRLFFLFGLGSYVLLRFLNFPEFLFAFFLSLWFIHGFTKHIFVKPYTICGEIHIEESSVTLNREGEKINGFHYKKVNFVYGGFKGKFRFNLFVSFLDLRDYHDGVSNSFIFDDDPAKKLQIMLRDKREYLALKQYLENLRNSGKEVVVTKYIVYQFKDYCKRFIKLFV